MGRAALAARRPGKRGTPWGRLSPPFALLARGGTSIEWFPRHAPELNPAEQVWNEFKGHSANTKPQFFKATTSLYKPSSSAAPTSEKSGRARRRPPV